MIEPHLIAPESYAVPRGATCAVKLPTFEGPLDLLLHLCRANEVDIGDLPVALISQQYLEYLELMRQLDIDVAAEYLLVAATLAHIKSRLLLPAEPGGASEDEGPDPRAELIRRLAEYARFQEAARELSERPRLGRDVFVGAVDRRELPEREPELSVSLFALMEAMARVLARIPPAERHHAIALERVSLADRMLHVMEILQACGAASILFEELLADGAPSRERVVITFLALLELARIQALLLFQNIDADGRPCGPVRVRLAVREDAPDAARISEAAARAQAELDARTQLDESPPAEPEAEAEPSEPTTEREET